MKKIVVSIINYYHILNLNSVDFLFFEHFTFFIYHVNIL